MKELGVELKYTDFEILSVLSLEQLDKKSLMS